MEDKGWIFLRRARFGCLLRWNAKFGQPRVVAVQRDLERTSILLR
jgi:hypothetical protein